MADFKDTYAIDTEADTSGLDKASSGISAFGSAALGAVSAIGGLAIVQSVTGFISDSVTAGFELEAELKRIADTTGLMGEELEQAQASATNLWAQGFGESPAEIVDALSQVQNITDATGDNLQNLTTYALSLSDAFGFDVQESTRAANQLMEQFGITGEEAFSIVAGIMQETGDPAGDLLDTLQEYSSIFAEMGLSADDVAGRMVQGAEAGVFGYDKTADAMREFTIRFKEGTDEQAAAWDTLIDKTGEFAFTTEGGLKGSISSFDELQMAVSEGSISIADAGDMMRDALMEIEDPAERAALATTLIGTQYEDLGEDILAAFDDDGTLTNFDGTIESIAANTLANITPWDRFKRGIQTFIGQAAVPVINTIFGKLNPALEAMTKWLTEGGLDGVRELSEGLINDLSPAFEEVADFGEDVVNFVVDLVGAFREFIAENPEVLRFFITLAATAATVITTVAAVSAAMSGLATVFGVVGAAIALLTSPIALIILALAGLVTAYQTNFMGFADLVNGAVAQIIPIVESLIATFLRIWDDVQPKLGELLAWFTGTGIPAIQTAVNAFLNDVLTPLIDALVNIWTTVQPGLQAFWDWFVSTGLPFIKLAVQLYIDNYVLPLIDLIAGFYNSVSAGLIDFAMWFLATGLPFIKLAVTTFMDNYIKPLIALVSGIYAAVSIGLNLFKAWFTETGVPAITGKVQTIIDIFNALRDRINTIWDAVSTALNGFKTNVENIFQGIWDAIDSVKSIVEDLIKKFEELTSFDLSDIDPTGIFSFAGPSLAGGGRSTIGDGQGFSAGFGQGFGGPGSSSAGSAGQVFEIHSYLMVDGQVLAQSIERVKAESPSQRARPTPPRLTMGVR